MSDRSRKKRGTSSAGGFSHVGTLVARNRRNRVVRGLSVVCQRYLSWYHNASFDLQSNGEAFVLQTISAFKPQVLFDVGANIGEWTQAACSWCPAAEIHAFEACEPDSFDSAELHRRLRAVCELGWCRDIVKNGGAEPDEWREDHAEDEPEFDVAS